MLPVTNCKLFFSLIFHLSQYHSQFSVYFTFSLMLKEKVTNEKGSDQYACTMSSIVTNIVPKVL